MLLVLLLFGRVWCSVNFVDWRSSFVEDLVTVCTMIEIDLSVNESSRDFIYCDLLVHQAQDASSSFILFYFFRLFLACLGVIVRITVNVRRPSR